MLNPTYLIQSRHNIYYFRYPLPIESSHKSNRISVSLKTRCPKKALRMAKSLEYHSHTLVNTLDLHSMKHADIMALFKDYYAEKLEHIKTQIDTDGQLPDRSIEIAKMNLADSNECIKYDYDDFYDVLGMNSSDSPAHTTVMEISKACIYKPERGFLR